MAKAIRATPTLVGKQAISFLENMKKKDKAMPTKTDKQLIDMVIKNQKFFSSRVQ
ncbi:MAG: hypothetical protein ABH986_00025 [archaeon]